MQVFKLNNLVQLFRSFTQTIFILACFVYSANVFANDIKPECKDTITPLIPGGSDSFYFAFNVTAQQQFAVACVRNSPCCVPSQYYVFCTNFQANKPDFVFKPYYSNNAGATPNACVSNSDYQDLYVNSPYLTHYPQTPNSSPSPTPTVSPTPLPVSLSLSALEDFGKVQMTKESEPQEVTVTNPSPTAVTFAELKFADGTQFEINFEESTCAVSASLAPNASCTLSVIFKPVYDLKLAGQATDLLAVTYVDQATNQLQTASTQAVGKSLVLLPTNRISQVVDECIKTPLGISKLRGDNPLHYIKDFGCALTALTELLNYTFSKNESVCTMNTFALEVKDTKGNIIGFDKNNDVNWDVVAKAYSNETANFLVYSINSMAKPSEAKLYLDSQLAFGLPVVVGVKLKNGSPRHYVVVNGQAYDKAKKEETYSINDPGDHTKTLLTDHSGGFVTRGSVESSLPIPNRVLAQFKIAKKPVFSDRSMLNLNGGTHVDILITDADGNKTGFDPKMNQTYDEIESAQYFVDGNMNNETGEVDQDVSHFLYVYDVSNKAYTISVIGNSDGPYNFSLLQYGANGSLKESVSFDGVASMGSVETFIVNQDGSITQPTPIPSPTPTVTPSPTPTPSNGIVTLTADQTSYSQGESAKITATLSSTYTVPSYSTLMIRGSLNGGNSVQMTRSGAQTFVYATSPLRVGTSTFVATAELLIKPSGLYSLDQSIQKVRDKIQISKGLKRFFYQLELIALQLTRAVLGLFQHETTEVIETDQINLIVKSAVSKEN